MGGRRPISENAPQAFLDQRRERAPFRERSSLGAPDKIVGQTNCGSLSHMS
jgi:hypothetical protein